MMKSNDTKPLTVTSDPSANCATGGFKHFFKRRRIGYILIIIAFAWGVWLWSGYRRVTILLQTHWVHPAELVLPCYGSLSMRWYHVGDDMDDVSVSPALTLHFLITPTETSDVMLSKQVELKPGEYVVRSVVELSCPQQGERQYTYADEKEGVVIPDLDATMEFFVRPSSP